SSRACLPLVPSATTTISETVLMRATKPWRTTAWSSITIILIVLSFIHHYSSASDWHVQHDFRAFVRAAFNLQDASDLLRTFLHADQTEMFYLAILRCLVIKTVSVILHT